MTELRPHDYRRGEHSRFTRLPAELKGLRQWVCWRLVPRPEAKPAKVPVDPKTGKEGSVADPATWGSFDEACARFESDAELKGIGFVFTAADPYVGVDVDDCREPETAALSDWAAELVKLLDTYVEVSPSGTGVKMIARGRPPGPATRRNKVEMYFEGRYFTLTGERLGVAQVNERQAQVDELYRLVFGDVARKKKKGVEGAGGGAGDGAGDDPRVERVRRLSDEGLLARARAAANGEKFKRLYDLGDVSGHGGDHSSADLALVALLAYWTAGDAERIDRLFRASKLFRPKWDERRGAQTYGARTVHAALAELVARYDPDAARANDPNDVGNAALFVELHGSAFAWAGRRGEWLRWNQHRWHADADLDAEVAARDVAAELRRQAAAAPSEDDRKSLWKRSLDAGNRRRLDALLHVARASLRVEQELDARPLWLAAQNGVVDLETGELREGRRSDWLTRGTPVRYDPRARCAEFERFLLEVMEGSAEMVEYLWRVLGYALTGDVSERTFFLLHGTGRNGKSTFVEVAQGLLGELGQRAKFSTFLKKSQPAGANDDVAHLHGARLVVASEADDVTPLDAALIKELTGDDRVRARFLYGREFEFRPQFKLFLVTNHVPPIKEGAHAFWDRLHYVPFLYRVPEEKVDRRLRFRLLAELEGVLARAVRGAGEWVREGLRPPAKVLKGRDEVRAEMDIVGQFLQDRCARRDDHVTPHHELYADFLRWHQQQGLRFPPSGRKFGDQLRGRGLAELRGAGNQRQWGGVGLKAGDEL